jgi:hypothetical protein
MKKAILCSIAFLLFTITLSAQTNQVFKHFKTDLGLGIVSKPSEPAGVLIFAEPSYSFGGNYKAGVRFEQASLNMKSINSYGLTFDYYLSSHSTFRPFLGVAYTHFNAKASGGCDAGPGTVNTLSTAKKFGAFIRTGFEFYHFRLSFEYNFVPSTYVSVLNAEGNTTGTSVYKNNYIGIKGSISIGGGRKK